MSELHDSVCKQNEDLSLENIRKLCVKSIEEVDRDLVDYAGWDMASPISAVSLKMGERNVIEQCSLHVFGENYGGSDHQIKVDKVELQNLIFR